MSAANAPKIKLLVDSLGRVVIPKSVRSAFDIPTPGEVELEVSGTEMTLRKSPTICAICGSTSNLDYEAEGKLICSSCFEKLREVASHE